MNGPEDFARVVDTLFALGKSRVRRLNREWNVYVDDFCVRTGRWRGGRGYSDEEYQRMEAEATIAGQALRPVISEARRRTDREKTEGEKATECRGMASSGCNAGDGPDQGASVASWTLHAGEDTGSQRPGGLGPPRRVSRENGSTFRRNAKSKVVGDILLCALLLTYSLGMGCLGGERLNWEQVMSPGQATFQPNRTMPNPPCQDLPMAAFPGCDGGTGAAGGPEAIEAADVVMKAWAEFGGRKVEPGTKALMDEWNAEVEASISNTADEFAVVIAKLGEPVSPARLPSESWTLA